jgi:hypothetical protein
VQSKKKKENAAVAIRKWDGSSSRLRYQKKVAFGSKFGGNQQK